MEPLNTTSRTRWTTLAAWSLLGAAMAGVFGSTFAEMWLRWFPAWGRADLGLYGRIVEGESYYTHGPIIPVLSLLAAALLIRYTRIEVRPDGRTGWPVLAGSLLLHLAACLARVTFASGLAMIGAVTGLVLLLWGRAALRRLWFAIFLLAFMVPLPEVTIADLNFRLKMLAADWGFHLATAVGVTAQRIGNKVLFAGGNALVIANACSGLRTLISLLALGAIFAYVCRLRGVLRWGLFAMTVPVAIVSNTLRIASLIAVAGVWGVTAASGWYHDWSSLMIFVLAFVLMFLLERAVLLAAKMAGRPIQVVPLFHGQHRGAADADQWHKMAAAAGGVGGRTAVLLLAMAACGTWWLNRSVAPAVAPASLDNLLPAQLSVAGRVLESNAVELDETSLTILEHPSYVYRRYAGADGPPVYYCVLFSRDNRKGIHSPDLCLEGSGSEIVGKGDVEVAGTVGEPPIPCRELIVQQGDETSYMLYTYKCGRRYTRSFWGQQMGIFANALLGRSATGALIRLDTPVATTVDDARRRLREVLQATRARLDGMGE